MSIIDREALKQSPLADLHAIASELSIDSYRRLRKDELINAILRRQEGDEDDGAEAEPAEAEPAESEEPAPSRRRRSRRGGRSRGGAARGEESEARGEGPSEIESELEHAGAEEAEEPGEEAVEGVVELLPGGAAFVRVDPPEPSDQDVYVSAAQVRRCELVSGDRIAGPRRPPRRSERFASLVRVDTINGQPASEVADSTRFEDLPAAFPAEVFSFDSEDATIRLITEQLPIGRGSRVAIVGERQAGKSETLRRLAISLAGQDGLDVRLVLVGVRPEEITEWRAGPIEPAAAVSIAASPDAQAQTVEVIEQARRLAARGADAVVLIDTLEWISPQLARRALAAARNIVDGGSLTVIATAQAAVGGETAVVALDGMLTQSGKFPAVDVEASWTMRAEQLRGEAG